MKKALSVFLIGIMVISFAACSKQPETKPESTTEATTQTTTELVSESGADVEITVPSSFFNEDDPATDELTEDQKSKGFKKAKINDDGSVTYTISEEAYKELKKTMKTDVADGLNELTEDYPQIRKVEFNDDFSDIKLYVVKKEYEDSMAVMAVYQAGLLGQTYQAYTGTAIKDLSVDVNVIDNASGEQFEEAHYPADTQDN